MRDATACLAQPLARFLGGFFEKKIGWSRFRPRYRTQMKQSRLAEVFRSATAAPKITGESAAPWRQANPRAIKRRASPRQD